MNCWRVIIQPRADSAALTAFAWIAERSPEAAARWLVGLRETIAKLANGPTFHPLAIEESARFGFPIREATYGRRRGVYRILFSVEAEVISILAIRHSAQNTLESLAEDEEA